MPTITDVEKFTIDIRKFVANTYSKEECTFKSLKNGDIAPGSSIILIYNSDDIRCLSIKELNAFMSFEEHEALSKFVSIGISTIIVRRYDAFYSMYLPLSFSYLTSIHWAEINTFNQSFTE